MKFQKYYNKINCVEDEEIAEVIHAHWISKIHTVLIAFLLFATPLFFMFYLVSQGKIGVSVFVSVIVIGIIYSIREWYMWSYNVFVISSHKIIDIEQKGMLRRSVSEVPYEKIVDISYEHEGLLDTMFGMGRIRVTTSIPNTTLEITHTGNVKERAGALIELVKKHGIKKRTELTSEQKRENFEDFMGTPPQDEASLSDLVEQYVQVYSKERLKKLIAKDLERASGIQAPVRHSEEL